MKTKKYDNILQLFVGNDEYREHFNVPFIIDNFVYATNCHELIRFPKENSTYINTINLNAIKSVKELFSNIKELKNKNTLAVEDLESDIDSIPLVDEFSNTNTNGKCNECDGDGTVEWSYVDYRKDFDCPICDGDGTVPIEKCEKTGNKIKKDGYYVSINNIIFNSHKISLLLEVAKIFNIKNIDIIGASDSLVLFKINDIEILLNAVQKSNSDIIINKY